MKTRVLVVSTVIIMVVVLYLWLGYFNGIVASGGESSVADQNQAQIAATDQSGASPSPEPGFWSRVGNGTAIVGNAIGGWAEGIGKSVQSPKEYIIK